MAPTDYQPTVVWKHRPSQSPEHPRPICRDPLFWAVGSREIPSYSCSPWDFYEPFVDCSSDVSLVLCNERTEVRMITTYHMASNGRNFSIPQLYHPNFTDLYELYYHKDQMFVISEYLDFSLGDLLKHSIWPTETEIACIISQVRRTDIILFPGFSN
jgi:hypothetical protein